VLARLVADTTHNGHFAVLDGRDTLYLIEERATGRPSLVTEVGSGCPRR
jgi:DNA-binding IclR family transcriptional regulator